MSVWTRSDTTTSVLRSEKHAEGKRGDQRLDNKPFKYRYRPEQEECGGPAVQSHRRAPTHSHGRMKQNEPQLSGDFVYSHQHKHERCYVARNAPRLRTGADRLLTSNLQNHKFEPQAKQQRQRGILSIGYVAPGVQLKIQNLRKPYI